MKSQAWQYLEKDLLEATIGITLGQRLRATLLLFEKITQDPGAWSTTLKCLHRTTGASPLFSNKGDVEFVSLELFPGIGHHLIEGSFQQVIPANDEPRKGEKPRG